METPTKKLEDSLEKKIETQFNEEKWTRISAKDVTISRFTLLDEIIEEAKSTQKQEIIQEFCKEQLIEYKDSVAARYILGMLADGKNLESDTQYLNELLKQFEEVGKWSSVVALSEKISNQDKNRAVLRAKLNALEKLGSKKEEVIPVLEKLAEVDKKNPDVALKFADAIINEDIDKGIAYYKQAAEAFARDKEFEKLPLVWKKLVDLIPEDFPFYRKIERILSGYRQKELLADLYGELISPYMRKEDTDNIIFLCKKVLEYNPSITRWKKEIIDSYRKKYAEHSLLEEFIQMSGLTQNKRFVLNAINSFETNIVFDKDNYVFHRSWGVGKIIELNTNEMIIDFKEKETHRMEIQMALKSLKPLTEEHFWVHQYQKPEELQKMFEEDFEGFFKILIRSFGDKISLAEIKTELMDTYVPAKDWSKWWTKMRSKILENDNISVSPQKKDVLEYHEEAISQAEQLMEKFQPESADKVAVALETLKKYRERERQEDLMNVILFMARSFKEGLKSIDKETPLLSLVILDLFKKEISEEASYYTEEEKNTIIEKLKKTPVDVIVEKIQNLSQTELKKELATFVQKNYSEWKKVFLELLFRTPVKIHNLLYSTLRDEKAQDELKEFYMSIRRDGKKNAEVFLWSFKNNFIGNDFEGFENETNYHLLAFFRLLKAIPKIELKGTKLKNNARDILLGSNKDRMEDLIMTYGKDSMRKFSALVRETNLFSDLEAEQIVTWMQQMNPEAFSEEELEHRSAYESIMDLIKKEGKTIASANALEDLRNELDKLINEDMPENSKEIGIAQEKGDLRENAEYKAAMEKQQTLQAKVKKIDTDLKEILLLQANQVATDRISIGSKVHLETETEKFVYSILDQWDADVDRGIIDYKSPWGQELIGHKVSDVVKFGIGKDEQNYTIVGIEVAVDENGRLK